MARAIAESQRQSDERPLCQCCRVPDLVLLVQDGVAADAALLQAIEHVFRVGFATGGGPRLLADRLALDLGRYAVLETTANMSC